MVQRRMEVEGGELELEDEVMLLPLPSNPHMLIRVQAQGNKQKEEVENGAEQRRSRSK